MKKQITILLCILLILTGSVSAFTIPFPATLKKGNTLYVGGTGAGNFSKIQDALDNTSNGDIVYVYRGIYYETLQIHNEITLYGEDKNITIIDGDYESSIITIHSDNVTIKRFWLKNSKSSSYPYEHNGITIRNHEHILIYDNYIETNFEKNTSYSAGIYLSKCENIKIQKNYVNGKEIIPTTAGIVFLDGTTHNLVKENQINDYQYGILLPELSESSYNNITLNVIYWNEIGIENNVNFTTIFFNAIAENNLTGIRCRFGEGSTIRDNIIHDNGNEQGGMGGIYLLDSVNNVVDGNALMWNKQYGIILHVSHETEISYNHIYKNDRFGIKLGNSYGCNIFNNNFIENDVNANFFYSFPREIYPFIGNNWRGNYWEDSLSSGLLPKMIPGSMHLMNSLIIKWFNIDWNPATEEYDVELPI